MDKSKKTTKRGTKSKPVQAAATPHATAKPTSEKHGAAGMVVGPLAAPSERLAASLCRGDLGLGGEPMECHVIDGEQRVFSGRGMMRAFVGSEADSARFGRFIERISREIGGLEVRPIRFTARGGVHIGYPVELLPRLCAAITDLALEGRLHASRRHLLANARRIEKALGGVAIVALVDEATGYQSRRAPDALARLYDAYFLPKPGDWSRAVPEELYVLLARLYGHRYVAGQQLKPLFFRSWTWKFVYDFLPVEIRAELRARNPQPHDGGPKHHQHLTPQARNVLAAHVLRLVGVLRGSATIADFRMRFDNEFRGTGLQLSIGMAP